jgi:hypothetical protein
VQHRFADLACRAQPWAAIGVRTDPAADRQRRLVRLLDELAATMPGDTARYQDWLQFAARWADLSVLWRQAQPVATLGERYAGLQARVDAAFLAWLLARRVLRCFLDWGVLQESGAKGVYRPAPTRRVPDPRVAAWLIEAILRARGAEAASLRGLAGSPALFPFEVGVPRRDTLEDSGRLEFFHQGVNEAMVLLHRTG